MHHPWKTASATLMLCAATAVLASAQTFTTLVSLDRNDGSEPDLVSLVQGTDGNLYGTTMFGGVNKRNSGTVFRITPGGALSTLHSFCSQPGCTEGGGPYAGLLLGTNGLFYGTTPSGGVNMGGTIYRITPGGTLSALYSFCLQAKCADGSGPVGALVQGSDGALYGTTEAGGADNHGTVFKINSAGTLTTLYSFHGPDGNLPAAALLQASDGNFYGTTEYGGSSSLCNLGCGTVFEITPAGVLTTLHSFDNRDGREPLSGLIQGSDGNLYGTTSLGGSGSACRDHCGTLFKITLSGTFTTLHSFDLTDGYAPTGTLIEATDGNFYGTTGSGGDLSCGGAGLGCGTVFEITPGGTLTTLHTFEGPDGQSPSGGIVQATNGTFYGTTTSGGTSHACSGGPCGTVFSLSVGLGPFVEALPAAGKAASRVLILGTNLTGATSVTFNGVAASFSVVSATEISTTVPGGATTGTIQVATPGGTLSSNVPFRVSQ